MKKTSEAMEIINHMMSGNAELQAMVKEASINAQVAQLIYTARTQAGLTQQQLAELIGSKQSAIARLEDADYEGHSLSMLVKIATALEKRIEIKMLPLSA